jgi:hypothetical protein
MDPAMDMPMNLASGRMLPYLHFTPGDILWFEGWVPGRSTTLFGTCVGLFVLALLHRWVVALRAALEFSIATSNMSHTLAQPLSEKRQKFSLLHRVMLRDAAPFVLRHALSRGILHMIQVSIGFLFMLAVMTFQVSFIFSIVIGQGVGEMLYGRYTSAARAAMHA